MQTMPCLDNLVVCVLHASTAMQRILCKPNLLGGQEQIPHTASTREEGGGARLALHQTVVGIFEPCLT
jgi:hypothetical protein